MAITVPSLWSLQTPGTVAPARPVMDDADNDLASLIERQNRVAAYNTRDVLAVGGSTGDMIDTSGISSATKHFEGVIKPGRTTFRCRLHVYGQYTYVLLYIGGVYRGYVLCGSTAGWYSSAILTVSVTLGSYAETLIDLRAYRSTTSAVTREYGLWVLEEYPLATSQLPDSDDSRTDYQRLDSDRPSEDRPLSGELCQAISSNAHELRRWRTRGSAIVHRIAAAPYLGSVYWRADGPYYLPAEPWVDTIDVVVRVVNPSGSLDMLVAAISEHELEDIDTLIPPDDSASGDSRIQLLAAALGSYQTLGWSGLRARPGALNRVWLVYRSDAATAASATGLLSSFDDRGRGEVTLTSAALTGISLSNTAGWLAESDEDSSVVTSGTKGNLTHQVPRQTYDVAARITDTGTKMLLSPPPMHKDFRLPKTLGFEFREVGYMRLLGLWVSSGGGEPLSSAELQAVSAVDRVPPSRLIDRARRACNAQHRHGTALIGIRHQGQRRLQPGPESTVGGWDRYQRGRYTYAPLDGATQTSLAEWAVPRDPASGSASADRVDTAQIRVGFDYMIFRNQAVERIDTVELEATVTIGAQTATQTWIDAPDWIFELDGLVSALDASRASIHTSKDASASPVEIYEHAYSQDAAWLPDVVKLGGALYRQSPAITIDLPASYPATLTLAIRSTSLGSATAVAGGIVCVGAWAVYDDRRSP